MAGKPIRLGKAAGELNVGISTLIEYLEFKGFKVDSNPNTKIEREQFRLLELEFLPTLSHTIQSAAEEFDITMTWLVEFLEENGFGISKPYRPTDPLTNSEYSFLKEKLTRTIYKQPLEKWLEEIGEIDTNGIGIGFKNFRRFETFPLIQLGDITFLVGKNNAGKSTLVKAYLLFMNYLQKEGGNKFYFAGEVLNDANIVTFNRAIFRNNINGQIEFNLKIDDFVFSINLSGKEDSTDARVNFFRMYHSTTKTLFEVDYLIREIYYLKNQNKENVMHVSGHPDEVQWYFDKIEELKKELSDVPNKLSREALSIIDQINKLQTQLDSLKFKFPKPKTIPEMVEYEASFRDPMPEDYGLKHALEDFSTMLDLEDMGYFSPSEKDFEELSDEEKERILIQRQKVKMLKNDESVTEFFKQAQQNIKSEQYFYLGANPSKQSALFFIRDKGNALAQAIHEFKQANIPKGSLIDTFVTHWMKQFEIGSDYSIHLFAGEAYEFYVIDESGSYHLSDKGMGSLQIMMLILRIATLLHNKKDTDTCYTVMVEEPELNLHPRLQSKLTEFFHGVYREHDFRFIIECIQLT